jgi:hypothetical protein
MTRTGGRSSRRRGYGMLADAFYNDKVAECEAAEWTGKAGHRSTPSTAGARKTRIARRHTGSWSFVQCVSTFRRIGRLSRSHIGTAAPNPGRVPNRCNLKPLMPRTPEKALYGVSPQQRCILYMVYCSLSRFRFPKWTSD